MNNRFSKLAFKKIVPLLFFLAFAVPLLPAEEKLENDSDAVADIETILVEESPSDQLANEDDGSASDISLPEITITEVTEEYADLTDEFIDSDVAENPSGSQPETPLFDLSIFDNMDDAGYVVSKPESETFFFEIPSPDDLDDADSMPTAPQVVISSEPVLKAESIGEKNADDETLPPYEAEDNPHTIPASPLSLPVDFLSGQSIIYYDSTEISQPIKLTFADGKTITLQRDESKRPKLKRSNPIFEWYLAAGLSVSRGTSYGYAGHVGLNFNISDDFTSGLYFHGEMLNEPLGSSSGMLAGFEVEADFGGNFTFPMFYGGPVAVKVGADFGYYMQILQFNSSISSQNHLGYNGMVIRPMLVFEFFRLLSSPIGFIFYYTNTAIVPYSDYNNLGLMVVI